MLTPEILVMSAGFSVFIEPFDDFLVVFNDENFT